MEEGNPRLVFCEYEGCYGFSLSSFKLTARSRSRLEPDLLEAFNNIAQYNLDRVRSSLFRP